MAPSHGPAVQNQARWPHLRHPRVQDQGGGPYLRTETTCWISRNLQKAQRDNKSTQPSFNAIYVINASHALTIYDLICAPIQTNAHLYALFAERRLRGSTIESVIRTYTLGRKSMNVSGYLRVEIRGAAKRSLHERMLWDGIFVPMRAKSVSGRCLRKSVGRQRSLTGSLKWTFTLSINFAFLSRYCSNTQGWKCSQRLLLAGKTAPRVSLATRTSSQTMILDKTMTYSPHSSLTNDFSGSPSPRHLALI